MTETRTSNTVEQLLQNQEPLSPVTWMKPRLLDSCMKAQSRLARPVDDSGTKLASVKQPDEAPLNHYSKSILHSIVLGNNSANENRLLREIYWHTVEALASQG